MDTRVEAAAVILAGGKSTRLGRDKGLLRLGELSLAERTVARFGPIFAELIYVTNRPELAPKGVRVVQDEVPHLGPLGGILAGLKAAEHDYGFVVAYDLPFASPDLAAKLLALSDGFDVVVPQIAGRYEPLHAVYARRCLAAIERYLAAGERRIVAFYEAVKVRVVKEDELSELGLGELTFFNINTWADYEKAKAMMVRNEERVDA